MTDEEEEALFAKIVSDIEKVFEDPATIVLSNDGMSGLRLKVAADTRTILDGAFFDGCSGASAEHIAIKIEDSTTLGRVNMALIARTDTGAVIIESLKEAGRKE